jgi:hypothetical protein
MVLGSKQSKLDLIKISCRHGNMTDLPAIAAGQFPGAVTQLEGHIQNGELGGKLFSGVACFWSIVSLLTNVFLILHRLYQEACSRNLS